MGERAIVGAWTSPRRASSRTCCSGRARSRWWSTSGPRGAGRAALGPALEAEADAHDVALAKVDVDANQELAQRYGVQGIPAVKAFRDGQVVDEFVGALPRPAVAAFLDRLTGPSEADRLVAELRAAGELPDVAGAVEAGDHERALTLLLDAVAVAPPEGKDALRDVAVRLFSHLGSDHPLTQTFRRRLAAALY